MKQRAMQAAAVAAAAICLWLGWPIVEMLWGEEPLTALWMVNWTAMPRQMIGFLGTICLLLPAAVLWLLANRR